MNVFHMYSRFTLDLMPEVTFNQNLLFLRVRCLFTVIFKGSYLYRHCVDTSSEGEKRHHVQQKWTSIMHPNALETLRMGKTYRVIKCYFLKHQCPLCRELFSLISITSTKITLCNWHRNSKILKKLEVNEKPNA